MNLLSVHSIEGGKNIFVSNLLLVTKKNEEKFTNLLSVHSIYGGKNTICYEHTICYEEKFTSHLTVNSIEGGEKVRSTCYEHN